MLLSWQKDTMLLSVDKSHFVMEEDVVSEFHLLKDRLGENIVENPSYHYSGGISCNILSKVIDYYKIHLTPSTEEIDLDLKFSKQLDPAVLFNLIQVLYFLPILVSILVSDLVLLNVFWVFS